MLLSTTDHIRVHAFSLYGPRNASHRVRLSQFQPGLAFEGINLIIHSLLDVGYLPSCAPGTGISKGKLISSYFFRLIDLLRCANGSDLVIIYAELFPLLPSWFELALLRSPYILDLDDAFYLKYRFGGLRVLSPFLGGKFDRLIAGAAAITAGNHVVAAYCRKINPSVFILPSVVDTGHYQAVRPLDPLLSSRSKPFTVGWIGSPTTAPYLSSLKEPLEALATQTPVRLIIVGGSAPSISGVEVCEWPWSLEAEVSHIHQFDVGVMPLPDTAWAQGKSAYKLIQYLACGVPAVASPVGANCAVLPFDCGFLASTPLEWLHAFQQLFSDPMLRQQMGVRGRRWVEQNYSLTVSQSQLVDLIRSLVVTKE